MKSIKPSNFLRLFHNIRWTIPNTEGMKFDPQRDAVDLNLLKVRADRKSVLIS